MAVVPDPAVNSAKVIQDNERKLQGLVRLMAPSLDEHDRDDLLQDVRKHLLEHSIPKFKAGRGVTIGTFLFSCSRNAIRDALRKRRRPSTPLPDELPAKRSSDRSVELLAAHLVKMAHAMLGGRMGELVELSHAHPAWTDAMIRAKMGLSQAALHDLRYRARAAVKQVAENELDGRIP